MRATQVGMGLSTVLACAIVAAGCAPASRSVSGELTARVSAPPMSALAPPASAPTAWGSALLKSAPPSASARAASTSAPSAPTSATAEVKWERVVSGDGFIVWCDAEGNARLTTDHWPWTQFPLPDNLLRRRMRLGYAAALAEAAAARTRPADLLEVVVEEAVANPFLAAIAMEDVAKALPGLLRDAPPGPQRKAALDISKRLLTAKEPVFRSGIVPFPYKLSPAVRRELVEAVKAAEGPATPPVE